MTPRIRLSLLLSVLLGSLTACESQQEGLDMPSPDAGAFGSDAGRVAGRPLGASCAQSDECQSDVCLLSSSGRGVCSRACVQSEECGGNFDCIDYGDDIVYCSALCDSDAQCNGWVCLDLGDGGPPVCSPPPDGGGSAGRPFGAACALDGECESGACWVANGAGICSWSCGEFLGGRPCTGDATCGLPQSIASEICLPPCASNAECNGWRCATLDTGERLCLPPISGNSPEVDDVGALCVDDNACDSGTCLRAANATGYCTQECTQTGECGRQPFLGARVSCVDAGGDRSFCFMECTFDQDCTGNTECTVMSGVRVCLP